MLLAARKGAPFDRLYAAYGRRLLRRTFAQLRVGGAPFPCADAPSIALVNHSAWWDPILALFLSHDLFRRDGVGLMQGAQLRRYPFFRRVGCFGATTTSLDDARALREYAGGLLRARPRRTLWLFPQGELLPSRAPLHFRSGAARIARSVPEAAIVPVAVRYELRSAERPEILVRVGPAFRLPSQGGPGSHTRELERRVGHELAVLDDDLARDTLREYVPVLRGRGSVSDVYDRLTRSSALKSLSTDD